MASSSDAHYQGGRHGRRNFQAPDTQNLKFYKGTQPSSPSVNQGTAVQPVHRSECGRPAVNGRPGMIPVLEKTIHWKYLLFGANLVTTLQIVNMSSVVVFSNFTRGPAEIWDLAINNHDVQAKTKITQSVIADAPTSFYISKKIQKMALLHILKFVTKNDYFFTVGHHIYKKRFLTLFLC